MSINLAEFPELKAEIVETKQIIIDILCHCLKSHGQRMRYYTIHNELIPKIIDLIKDNSNLINLGVVKFIKSIFYNNVFHV